MDHINYFLPYKSISPHHEDQLTRAFLVTLRFSPAALFMFYDLVRSRVLAAAKENHKSVEIPSLSEIDLSGINFKTQKNSLEIVTSEKLISVALIDEHFSMPKLVSRSKRKARYDGIVTFGNDVSFFIETKKRVGDVWPEQLSPGKEGLNEDIELIPVAADIEWKEIINRLNGILEIESLSGPESMIINDFLKFIWNDYPDLNPYDNLSLCRDNWRLINDRINMILNDIVKDGIDVEYRRGWRVNAIHTQFDEISLIGIEILVDKNNSLRIALNYGDTLGQSRKFYSLGIGFEKIKELIKKGWIYKPNFHLSYWRNHLIWFETLKDKGEIYYNYWLENIEETRQSKKSELSDKLQSYSDLGLIRLNSEILQAVDDQILSTKRDRINVCPGFGLYFTYELTKASEMDKAGIFAAELISRIREGIGILGKKASFLKN